MKIKKYIVIGVIAFFTSCTGNLDREPFYDLTSANVYNDFANYKSVLAKLYAGFVISGQQGPAGKPDITGLDEGFSNYIRQYYCAQELPTDEAVIAWGDPGLPDYHLMNWSSSNQFITTMYNRIYYQISLCNEFIRETSDEKLNARGISGANLDEAKIYHAEARFLRALSYWHAIDLFGNVPFVTENDPVGTFLPPQISRRDLFNYIESELKDIEGVLIGARQNEYGRADKAAAWTLLAKLYLNAQVYTGEPKYTEAITYCNNIINGGYSLEPNYRKLFLTDNNTTNEAIFVNRSDGLKTKGYGAVTFLVHAPVGGSMKPGDFGISGGWGGLRTTKQFVSLFTDITGNTDKRAMFHTDGQKLEIDNVSTFTDGYAIGKFRNVSSTGQVGQDPVDFPDTDFLMFRLADVYLMYAEAVLRGGTGGDATTALQYINLIRQRAYGNTSGNITSAQLTLPFILDERGRELFWECQRRTDLVRFGVFTTGLYVWAWKGGVKEGRAVESYRNLFPIPAADITANPNLDQNDGY